MRCEVRRSAHLPQGACALVQRVHLTGRPSLRAICAGSLPLFRLSFESSTTFRRRTGPSHGLFRRCGRLCCNRFMFRILLLLFAGACAGYFGRRSSFVRRTASGMQITVCALLFVFGASLGSDKGLIADFGRFGGHALLIAVLGVAGSLLAAAAARRFFWGKGGRP